MYNITQTKIKKEAKKCNSWTESPFFLYNIVHLNIGNSIDVKNVKNLVIYFA